MIKTVARKRKHRPGEEVRLLRGSQLEILHRVSRLELSEKQKHLSKDLERKKWALLVPGGHRRDPGSGHSQDMAQGMPGFGRLGQFLNRITTRWKEGQSLRKYSALFSLLFVPSPSYIPTSMSTAFFPSTLKLVFWMFKNVFHNLILPSSFWHNFFYLHHN